jgi:hypothetical protein
VVGEDGQLATTYAHSALLPLDSMNFDSEDIYKTEMEWWGGTGKGT